MASPSVTALGGAAAPAHPPRRLGRPGRDAHVGGWRALVRVASFAALTLLLARGATQAAPVPRADCFPFERLDTALRAKAEALLLRALDREALYTIIGGVKPVSSGFATFDVDVAAISPAVLEGVDETRRVLAAWRCGETYHADVVHFARVHGGKRSLHAVLAHRPALSTLLRRHPTFFGALGLSPSAHPVEVLLAVEYADPLTRFRGYGRLFGYPEEAVTFFVDAAASQERDGQFVARDFRSIPTFERETHQFVYAVPKGAPPSPADRGLAERAAPILQAYRHRRARFIGPGRPGVVELLRDWFDTGDGRCDPDVAELRALFESGALALPPATVPAR